VVTNKSYPASSATCKSWLFSRSDHPRSYTVSTTCSIKCSRKGTGVPWSKSILMDMEKQPAIQVHVGGLLRLAHAAHRGTISKNPRSKRHLVNSQTKLGRVHVCLGTPRLHLLSQAHALQPNNCTNRALLDSSYHYTEFSLSLHTAVLLLAQGTPQTHVADHTWAASPNRAALRSRPHRRASCLRSSGA
jgi:hypothetical protein